MKKVKELAVKFLAIIFGNAVLAFGIVAFAIPNNFLVGGTTGIARIMENYFSISVTVTVAAINVIMFFLGFIFLGKQFAFTTLISSFVYPIFLNLFLSIESLKNFTSDMLLSAIIAGILIGFGLGLVMRMGGSTGGMDIPLLILNKKCRVPIAVAMYACDFIILLFQMLFSNSEQVLYGLLSVLITTIVLNKIMITGAGNIQATIISQKWEEINEVIQEKMDRGSTFIKIETGYNHDDQRAVMCILPSREVSLMNSKVLEIDPHAFIVINSVRDVRGKGFSLDRHI